MSKLVEYIFHTFIIGSIHTHILQMFRYIKKTRGARNGALFYGGLRCVISPLYVVEDAVQADHGAHRVRLRDLGLRDGEAGGGGEEHRGQEEEAHHGHRHHVSAARLMCSLY